MKTGEFAFALELIEGANLIQVEAESSFGPVAKETRIVHYQTVGIKDPETKSGINPIYYAIGILCFLALILIFAISNLVKKK